MQLSAAAASGGSPTASIAYSSVQQYEQSYQSESSFSIDFSNSGDSVTITGHEHSLYRESLYTSKGMVISSTNGAPASDEAASVLESESMKLADEIVSDYLQAIRQRVNQLIQNAAELSNNYERYLLGLESAGESSGYGTTIISMETESVYELETESVTQMTLDVNDFSAENTAARIVQFALAFYDGGDKAAYAEEVRAAVMEGFQEAEAAFGGMLPDVSYETIDLVNQALDQFASEGSVDFSA